MKKIISLIISLLVAFSVLFLFTGCHSRISSDKDYTKKDDFPYDESGLYEKEITERLSEFGSVYWDVQNNSYVLKPRNALREAIIGLVIDPLSEEYIEYWDFAVETIREVTEKYPCTVCMANPVNADAYLLVVVIGTIGYSAF